MVNKLKQLDLANVPEQQEFVRMEPGGYICRVCKVDDVVAKEYLLIEYDIAEGQHKGRYTDLWADKGFWAGKLYRSYKQTALSQFKGFITAVANSNKGFAWNSDEQQLVNKLFGAVIAEEQYLKKDGSVGTRLYVSDVRSVDKIKAGDFKTPPLKMLNNQGAKAAFGGTEVNTDDLPFK
jgi:hypothetical protein